MQKWVGWGVFLALGAAVGGAACSSSATDKYPSFDVMCADVATQECQVTTRCVTITTEACTAARKKLCLDAGSAAIAAGRRYNSAGAQGCVDKAKATYASDKSIVTPKDLADLEETCQRVYEGSADKAGACTRDYDCASSRVCTVGHCGDKTLKGKNDGCANPGDVCDPSQNLYCQPQTGTSTCVVRAVKGEVCTTAIPCEVGLRCVGTCQDGAAPGASCSRNEDCGTAAPFCDPYAGGICTPGLTFSVGGSDCRAFTGAVTDAGLSDATSD